MLLVLLGGYKDDSKKQPDPSKDGFTGIGNMSIDAIRKMSARIEKEKTKKEEVEVVDEGSMKQVPVRMSVLLHAGMVIKPRELRKRMVVKFLTV